MSEPPPLDKLVKDAEAGNSAAQYNLGVRYLRGDGVEADTAVALRWIERSADAGMAPAQSALGYLYLRAQGVPYEPRTAVTLFRRAAEQGFAEAIYRYADALATGLGCEQDAQAARAEFVRAAAAGHPLAQCQLAYCLDQGIGGAPDPAAATDWLFKAAGHGSPRAAAAIAWRFQHAHTLDSDADSALDWLLRAADSGYPGAVAAVASLAPDDDKLAAARNRARQPPLVVKADPGLVVDRLPVMVEPVCESPRVSRLENLLSREECWHLMQIATPFLRPSKVLSSQSGADVLASGRRSGGMSIIEPQRDVVVWNIERRLAGIAGLPVENGEPLALLRYEPGDEYRPHFDFFDPQIPGQATALETGGQRLISILIYLNDVEEGGETRFPNAGISVRPQPGMGVLFHNCTPDGEIDRASRHAGAPVRRGQKWLATKWIRESAFVAPLSEPAGHPAPS